MEDVPIILDAPQPGQLAVLDAGGRIANASATLAGLMSADAANASAVASLGEATSIALAGKASTAALADVAAATVTAQQTATTAQQTAGTAQQAADAAGTFAAQHAARADNPHAVTKAQVGLASVPNLDTTTAVAKAHDAVTLGTANGLSLAGQAVSLATATTAAAGAMAAADKAKLDGVAVGATANAADAQLRDRSTHTGTQAIGTVAGLSDALERKASSLGQAAWAMDYVTSLDEAGVIFEQAFSEFTNDVYLYGSTYGQFYGDGTGLGSLNANSLTSGTVPVARLGASGTRSNATVHRGDNTWDNRVVGTWEAGNGHPTYPSIARLDGSGKLYLQAVSPSYAVSLEAFYNGAEPFKITSGLDIILGQKTVAWTIAPAVYTSAFYGFGIHTGGGVGLTESNLAIWCAPDRKVGVGVTSPVERFEVAGRVKATGYVGAAGKLGLTVDGNGSVVTAGSKGPARVDTNATIVGWYVDADVATSCSIDVYADGTLISGTSPITLTAATAGTWTALTGWTVNVAQGARLTFNVTNNTAATRLTITLLRAVR